MSKNSSEISTPFDVLQFVSKGYNGKVRWRLTTTEEVAFPSTVIRSKNSGGILEKVHYVNSALEKEVYGGVSFSDTTI